MRNGYYTLASWYVRDGQTEEFLRIWREELADAFLKANPKAQGTLIQSLDDPRQFYSFGPWETMDEMETARTDTHVRAAISRLLALCEEARPSAYQVVLTLPEEG